MDDYEAALNPGAKRKIVPSLAALILLALCVHGRGLVTASRNMQLAQEQYIALTDQIARYRENTGVYPEELSDLDWSLYGLFPDGKPKDPWGKTWIYSLAGKAEGNVGFQLGSCGPDGQPGGGDDPGFVRIIEKP